MPQEEPGCRLLCGTAAAAQRFGAEPTAITNHEGARPVPADDAGTRSALHHQPPGPDTDLKRWFSENSGSCFIGYG
jgi:hypothetical protein